MYWWYCYLEYNLRMILLAGYCNQQLLSLSLSLSLSLLLDPLSLCVCVCVLLFLACCVPYWRHCPSRVSGHWDVWVAGLLAMDPPCRNVCVWLTVVQHWDRRGTLCQAHRGFEHGSNSLGACVSRRLCWPPLFTPCITCMQDCFLCQCCCVVSRKYIKTGVEQQFGSLSLPHPPPPLLVLLHPAWLIALVLVPAAQPFTTACLCVLYTLFAAFSLEGRPGIWMSPPCLESQGLSV